MDSIKHIDLLGDFKSDKIYYFYKTSSSEINLEILSQLQKYESSLDFFSFYTKNDIKNLINSASNLDKNLTSIFNDASINFSSNTDKYISKISKIILALNLIQKTQEILNKLLLESKQYLNEISNNCKIENIYKDKLLSLINNLQYDLSNDIPSSYNHFSTASSKVNSSRSLSSINKKLSKFSKETNDSKIQEEFFNKKKSSIVNEEILSDIQTPGFTEKKSNNNVSTVMNTSNNKIITNKNNFDLSFRDMFFIFGSDSKTEDNSPARKKIRNKKEKSNKENSLHLKKNKTKNRRSFRVNTELLNIKSIEEEDEIKMYCDFLLLVKKLYKSCLITAEERIKIKKLIISKSNKIINFYNKEYENIKDDYLKIANAIRKLL